MKLTDYERPGNNRYMEFEDKHAAVLWLLENDFTTMPNTQYPDIWRDNFFRHKKKKIGIVGWNF